MTEKSSLRLGYNSMGADCAINNLHFHLVDTEKIFGSAEAVFPIEEAEKKLFFTCNLQHIDKSELNMYNCGVRFGELLNWPVQTLLLSPELGSGTETLDDAQEALTHAAGVVINHMIETNMPHNILIADEGMTMYIMPRKFDLLLDESVNFYTSFESLSGFAKYKTEAAYEQAQSGNPLAETLAAHVSLDTDEWENFKGQLMEKFSQEYECKPVENE